MSPHDRLDPKAPVARTLVALALTLVAGALAAEDYINAKEMPEKVLKRSIERLATFIVSQELEGKRVSFKVTRILGRESLGDDKQRVWFCIEGDIEGKKSTGCGGDNVLIKLDTGRWILQDVKRGSWIVVEQ